MVNLPKRVRLAFYAGLGAVVLAEIAAPHVFEGEVHFGFERLPAWGSLYGLVSCVVIIVASKLLGHAWLARPENHYDPSAKKP